MTTGPATDACDEGAGPRVRIIGLGNALRGDDAVGLHVAARVRQLMGRDGDVITAEMAGVEVLPCLEGYDVIILADAARTGAEAGTIHRWSLGAGTLRQHPSLPSSHGINALDAIELARTLGLALPRIVLYGVEIGRSDVGAGLSGPVARVVEPVARRILQEAKVVAGA